jgi:hypothetical protein
MSTHIIQIGKYKFICGLFWQSLSRPRELGKEAADLARKIDCDLVVLRREYSTAQAGFAQSTAGPRQVLYSLAAAVASKLARDGANYDGENQPVHNWLAAFKLPDGLWAYFAVRDANFLPNGDFAGTREEVFERLHGDYGLGGWNLVIGDAELEDYGFHNFTERRIEDLLSDGKEGQLKVQPGWLVRPVSARVAPKSLAIGVGCAAAVLFACMGGWKYYQLSQARARAAEEAELVREIESRRHELAAIPHPWAHTPSPVSLAKACMEQMLHLTAGGWALTEYACSPQGIRYAWKRQDSTVDFLLAQVPGAAVDLNGENATYTQALALAPGGDETLHGYATLMPAIQSRLQLLDLNMRLSLQAAPGAKGGVRPANKPATAKSGAAGGTVRPDWVTYRYVINAISMSPVDVAAILSAPGIRLDKLTYRGTTWSMEGAIYAK